MAKLTSPLQCIANTHGSRANRNSFCSFERQWAVTCRIHADQCILVVHDDCPRRHALPVTIHHDGAVCPCSERKPTALRLARQRLAQGQFIRLDLVQHASSRVLSPWLRALAKTARHLQSSACGTAGRNLRLTS